MTRRLVARYVRMRTFADRGAATAEYAVVSVAAAGLGGLLIKLVTSDWFQSLLMQIFQGIVHTIASCLA